MAFAYDVLMATLAVLLALLLRYGDFSGLDLHLLLVGVVLPFACSSAISFLLFRTYRTSWRHVSSIDLITLVHAVSLASLGYVLLSFVATRLYAVPRSSIILSWLLSLFLLGGSRIIYRLFHEGKLFFVRQPMLPNQLPILVVGGPSASDIFLRSLDRYSDYYPVGILDVSSARGGLLRGVPILGSPWDAEQAVSEFGDAGDRPRKIVLADRQLSQDQLEHLVDVALRLGITIARAPDPTLLEPAAKRTEDLQAISVEDLLGRPQVILDSVPIRELVSGKRVLVTGAGGSIGSEIVRQVCALGPAALCLLDASEFNLYAIDSEVTRRWSLVQKRASIIDVRHKDAIDICFSSFGPDIVFHAAALKHVPLVEENPVEGIWTNIIGTRNIADAAAATGCRTMVFISTDKAVNPTNIMGATKRCAESYCQALALAPSSKCRFVAVRFGNVLGSTGSVVPLFERQLKAGGPLTVTHPDIQRFFMTIREAVQLVLHASALGTTNPELRGKIFVLDMGEPVRIADLARQMIRLAGLRPDIDINIEFTGLRRGEKLYEELFHESEDIETTDIPRIFVASPRGAALADLRVALSRLEKVCQHTQQDEAIAALRALVPEFNRAASPPEVPGLSEARIARL